jgi:ABC-2 type transport system ATP-binding protein
VEHSIAIRDLTKNYGAFAAVSGLTLEVEPGSICGLLGPNGAGKSTTFKCLLGLARPTSGSIAIEGAPLAPATFENLAYVPERSMLYDNRTLDEHLEFYRRCYARYDAARARELVDMFKIERRKKIDRLSKGQRTAVALILAFSTRPRIFVLDEPSSGLDPVFQRLVLDLMIEAAAGGATVLFSSHQIGQVERAADRVAILKNGKLVVDGSVDELKTTEKIVEAIFASTAPDIDGLAGDPRVRRIERSGRIVRAYVRDGSEAIAKRFEEFSPKDVSILDLGLEDIFLTAVEGRDATIPHGDQE